MKKILIFVVIFVIIINLPPLKSIFGQEDVLYSNANGTFTFDEVNDNGRNYNLCIDNFEAFKEANKKDTLLYRITPKIIFKFWRWGEYLSNEKYTLPFKSWTEIKTVRGPIHYKTNWQAF